MSYPRDVRPLSCDTLAPSRGSSSFIKESIFSRRKLRFFSHLQKAKKRRKKKSGTHSCDLTILAQLSSRFGFSQNANFSRERPGEFYKRIKAETVFCKRAYGNMEFQRDAEGRRGLGEGDGRWEEGETDEVDGRWVYGKRGAIQLRNSCIKDTKEFTVCPRFKKKKGKKRKNAQRGRAK